MGALTSKRMPTQAVQGT